MMTPNPKLLGLLAAALLMGLAPGVQAQAAQALYQQALRKEQIQGDLEGAIGLFRQVVAAGDRALAARALIHIGKSYERLGKPGAEGPYRRVVTDFADQSEPVAQARARLTAMGIPSGAVISAKAPGVVTRLIAAAEDIDRRGRISPDGRWISGAGGVSEGGRVVDPLKADLFIRELTTGARRQVTHKTSAEEAVHRSVWSPDGRRIAYLWTIGTSTSELRVIGVDGRDMTTLLRDPEGATPMPEAWTADGRQVLTFLFRRDGTMQLALVPLTGGAPRVLSTFRDSAPRRAGLSPDQRWIAFSLRPGLERGDFDLYALSIDGGRRIPLVEHLADDQFLGWDPAGILFTSNRRGTVDLFLLPMRGVQPTGPPVLIKAGISQSDPSGLISPTGVDRRGTLYYRTEVQISHVLTVPIDPGTWETLGVATLETGAVEGKSTLPDWSPDGLYFGYVSLLGAAEMPTVVVRREATREERRVELPQGLLPAVIRIAPGGERVLVAGWETVRMWDVAKGTQEALRLSEDASWVGKAGNMLPGYAWWAGISLPGYAWSGDGRRLFYTTQPRGKKLIARDLATGQELELYAVADSGFLTSLQSTLDGKLLAFTVQEGSRSAVVAIGADGGEPRELVSIDHGDLRPIAFSPDGGHLIYQGRGAVPPYDNARYHLYRVPVRGGDPAVLAFPTGILPIRPDEALRMRPDGRRVAFIRNQSLNQIWALENLPRPPRDR